ncbi:hypothetical protein M3221_05575 [Domibacillus indicus]|uniref:hypothetical protein n=1 Tax=Domibacillus indicus TaxID=1437523 RepID=UPI00203FD5A8|nr:hypothetical protein [Domibacillus indicus]MCM3787887.1 hypothetical protein [Domibacillus indicus]
MLFKWWSTLLLIAPFIFILGLLFFCKDLQSFFLINGKLPDEITNTSDLVSWMFGGIMSLLGFITLFIAFSYENKLLTASKIKQQLLRPYALSLEEIMLNFSEYKLYLSKDFLLNFIYWIFVIVSAVSIFSWGIIICFYTNFDFVLSSSINYKQIINLVVLAIWGLLSFVLIALTILLNLIRFNKDPLDKGYLLDEKQLSDVQIILEKKGDLHELLFKIAPTITLLKNPSQENHELNIYFPLKLANIRFVAKLYNNNMETPIRIFGVLKNIDNIGEGFSHILASELNLAKTNLNEQSTGIIKFYDQDNKIIALLKLKAQRDANDIQFKTIGKIDLKLITNDNDYRDIENREDEFVDYSE